MLDDYLLFAGIVPLATAVVGAAAVAITIGTAWLGSIRPRYWWAPFLASSLVVLAYLAAMAGFWIWAADCWECPNDGSEAWSRESWFAFILMYFWIPFAAMIAVTWIGVLIALTGRWLSNRRASARAR